MKLNEVSKLRFSRHVKERILERYRGAVLDINKKLYQLLLESVEYPEYKFGENSHYLKYHYGKEYDLMKFYKACGIVFLVKQDCVVTCFYK